MKRPKEDISKLLTSKGFNHVQSKSVNKSNKPIQKTMKEKNISLEKHQNREIITKTQTGFYIMTGGGIIQEKEQESTTRFHQNANYARNKIYNVKSPKLGANQRTKNMPTNTE